MHSIAGSSQIGLCFTLQTIQEVRCQRLPFCFHLENRCLTNFPWGRCLAMCPRMTVGWSSLFLNVKDHRISLHQVWPGPPEKFHDFRNIYDFRPRMFHLWVPGLGTEDVVLKDVLRKRKNMEDTGLLGRKNLVFCYWLQLSPSIFFHLVFLMK